MKRRTTVRASRLASPTNQVDRGARLADRRDVDYWCADDHQTTTTFAAEAEAPVDWVCPRCGGPAALERGTSARKALPAVFPRTPYQFLMMRRTAEDGERLLAEALAERRKARAAAARA